MDIVEALAASGHRGVKNTDLVLETGNSAAVISRDLSILREQGWAERQPDGRTRLSPTFAGFSNHIAQSLRQARLELQSEESRYVDAMGGHHE